jgi:hypothetical protein
LFFRDRSARWVADTCRAGRVPGAIKVGKVWMIRASDFEAFVTGSKAPERPQPQTPEDAAEVLRRHGVAV